jgi:CheY-like chemotaxis protein/HPt (histidine-containing phosphotransfer) domain-containing protein
MTSLGQQNIDQLAEIGFAAGMTKPVRPSELYAHLTAAIAGAPKHKETPVVVRQNSDNSMNHATVRILVAEDNAINQLVAIKLLDKLGYHADAVANGQEAITSLRTMPYDLVLMDCQMPEMDGFEATRAIRGGSSGVPNPQVPIIAMTANAMDGDKERCLDAGMSDYLSKPVQLHGLAAMLEKWLVEKSISAATAAVPAHIVTNNAPVNSAIIVSELASDPDLCVVAEMFIERVSAMVSEIADAAANADTNLLKKLAHTLKGASGSAGFPIVAQKAAAIEQSILKNAIDAMKNEVDELNMLCKNLSAHQQESIEQNKG